MKPQRRALGLLGLLLVVMLWPGLNPALPLAFAGTLLAVDALLVRRELSVEGQRSTVHSLAVNTAATIQLKLRNRAARRLHLEITDETPASCELPEMPFPLVVELDGGGAAEISYALVPLQRGDLSFGRLLALLRSPLGFWQRRVVLDEPSGVRVYPDFALIASYLDLLADQQAVQLGIRRAPRRGEGLEFHQLREYRSGDSVRQIDWKATARRRALISREYQEERDQRVLFLIDSGRRMRARDGRLSHFDYALNAMLLLSYVALRQGDTVGLKVFGHEQRWVPPQRGVAGVNVLLNATYDLHTGTEAADFLGAAEDVMTRQRKRALIVLLTNLREEDQDLLSALGLLRRRHVVMIGNLRERILDDVSARQPKDFDEALAVVGTHGYLAARRSQHQQVAALGQLVVDCTPEELPVSVVNAYWRIKRSGLL